MNAVEKVCLPLAMALACQDLPRIPENVCGNLVAEENEECDSGDLSVCHPPDAGERACRLVCNAERVCPAGSGCGADAVCRKPSGVFVPTLIDDTESGVWLEVADLNGDQQDELLVGPYFGSWRLATFPNRNPVLTDTTISGLLATGDLDCDQRTDAIGSTSRESRFAELGDALTVWRGNDVPNLVPVSLLAAPPQGSARRLLAADTDGDARVEPLMLVDSRLYRVNNSAEFQLLFRTDVSASDIAGTIPSGDWDESTACDEIALASYNTNVVHVYTLCDDDPENALVGTLQLPGDVRIGERGLFSADVDGDGLTDLIATTGPYSLNLLGASAQEETDIFYPLEQATMYITFGAGDGTFHDASALETEEEGNSRMPSGPIPLPSPLLAAADLDGDAHADFILEEETLLSSSFTSDCPSQDISCAVFRDEPWNAASVADFNRDGLVDLIGAPVGEGLATPYDARKLTFAMGLGDGAFNVFFIPTEGVLTSAVVDSEGRPNPTFAVGDFNGDLVNDLAFVQRLQRASRRATLSVLFGTPLGTPIETTHVVTADTVTDLAAGVLFSGQNIVTDLTVLAQNSEVEGVGLIAGRTDRLLFSSLAFPDSAAASGEPGFLVDVALGHFRNRGEDESVPGCADESKVPNDMVVLAERFGEDLLLYFVANTEHGFDSAVIEAPTPLPGSAGLYAGMAAVDIDAEEKDAVDEIVVYSSAIEEGRFAYWIVRRAETGLLVEDFSVEIPELVGQTLNFLGSHTLWDVDGNGRMDLAFLTEGFGEAPASYVLVFPNMGRGHFEAGIAFLGLPDPTYDVAYLNVDADPALEAVAATDLGIQLFDVSFEKVQLIPRSSLQPEKSFWSVMPGDFDGDGVTDLAAEPYAEDEVLQVFWGEAERQ